MSGLSRNERKTVERAAAEPMLDQVQAWAAINSGTTNLAGLSAMAGLLADAFSVLPGTLLMREPDQVEAIGPDGVSVQVAHGRNLHLTVRPDAPLQLLFTGHIDTVFPSDHPFQALTWLDDATLRGPGVADMKGGLAVMLAALKAVETIPVAGTIGYEVVINSDEEAGSPGSAALIRQAARGKAAALTYEPAVLPDGTLAASRPGSGNFAFVVTGKSAHAGRNPEEGRNALVAAADLAVRLNALKSSSLRINPARIDGGSPVNVVPDLAILRVNVRPATEASAADAKQAIAAAIAGIEKKHEVTVRLHGGFGRPPKSMTREAEKLFSLVGQAGADLGQVIGWQASGGVCDGNNIAACGVPVVDTMGVRGGSIHSPDEYLIVSSLAERAALSALTILRLAGSSH